MSLPSISGVQGSPFIHTIRHGHPSQSTSHTTQPLESHTHHATTSVQSSEAMGVCCPGCPKSGGTTVGPVKERSPAISRETTLSKASTLSEAMGECCPGCPKSGDKAVIPSTSEAIGECCPGCKTTGENTVSPHQTKASLSKPSASQAPLSANAPNNTDPAKPPLKRIITEALPTPVRPKGDAPTADSIEIFAKPSPGKGEKEASAPPKTTTQGDKPVTPGKNTPSAAKAEGLVSGSGTNTITLSQPSDIQAPRLTLTSTQDPHLRLVFSQQQFTGSALVHAQGQSKALPETMGKAVTTLANNAATPGDRIVAQNAIMATMQALPTEAQAPVMIALHTISTAAPKQFAQITQVLQKMASTDPQAVKGLATALAKTLSETPLLASTITQTLQAVAKTMPQALPQVHQAIAKIITAKMTHLQVAAPPANGDNEFKGLRPLNPENPVQSQNPETLAKVATQLSEIVAAAPKDAPAVLTTLAKMAEQSPKATAAIAQTLAQVAQSDASALAKVTTQLSQIVAAAPKEAPAILTTVAKMAEQSPKATAAIAQTLAQVAKSDAGSLAKVSAQISQIIESTMTHLQVALPPANASISFKGLRGSLSAVEGLNPVQRQNTETLSKVATQLSQIVAATVSNFQVALPLGNSDVSFKGLRPLNPENPVQSQNTETLAKVSAQISQIVADATKEAPAILTTLAKMAEQSPQSATAITQVLGQVATSDPGALKQVSTQLSQIIQSSPEQAPKIVSGLQIIAENAPASLSTVINTIATIATLAPAETSSAMTTLSQTAQNNPASTAAVATFVAEVATHTPQQLPTVFQTLQSIATQQPQSLPQITQTLTQVIQQSPGNLAQVATNLSQIVSLATADMQHLPSASPMEDVTIFKGLRPLNPAQNKNTDTLTKMTTQLAQIIEASPKEARQITAAIAQIAQQDVSAAAKTVATLSQILDATPKNLQPMLTQIAAHVVPAVQLPVVMSQMGKVMANNLPVSQKFMQSMSGLLTPGQSFAQLATRFQTVMLQLAQFAKQGIDISALKDRALNTLFGNRKMDAPQLQALLARAKNMGPEELSALVAQYIAGLEQDALDADKKIREAEAAKAAEHIEENEGFTEALYQLFNQQEMENWAAAAYFRMKTKKQAKDAEAVWHQKGGLSTTR